jgi:hypothetical protein
MTGDLRRFVAAISMAALLCPAACSSSPKPDVNQIRANWLAADTRGLSLPTYNADVNAVCDPPIGWKPDPLKTTDNHTDQVWLSPTRDTAYGVIHFTMPLPIGQNLAFNAFLTQMQKTQGEAKLLDRKDDPNLPGIRFTAEGKIYVIRVNFFVQTWEGWAVYAGTHKSGPILQDELETAIRAREHTHVGTPK